MPNQQPNNPWENSDLQRNPALPLWGGAGLSMAGAAMPREAALLGLGLGGAGLGLMGYGVYSGHQKAKAEAALLNHLLSQPAPAAPELAAAGAAPLQLARILRLLAPGRQQHVPARAVPLAARRAVSECFRS